MNDPSQNNDRNAQLDALFAPLEQRPVLLDREKRVWRRDGAALLQQLNRLQGAVYSDVHARLDRLWCNVQVNKQEFVELVAEIGRRKLFNSKSFEVGGR